ncbi:GNAT family N-acetyltransferase [Nocardioides sp. cx-173]|uniref:GNAT family N-acetyltransferase n=1 Tax=Nocardioides sp. cx-173 TaxID=2898796 RepID=UPI001E631920|nr:GNAT family N-acetyltransferase [Nocardioides sp. cx-173]MCD4525456.1 GNAT family N-acetyltransferase [Nocardioides sp. cx-173]UGB42602.1 GNAT family N-acetyltransferase [Nocardioides sp. cx-173]
MTHTPGLSEAEALAALAAHPAITWRPFGREDLPAIADLYAECEAYDRNPERQSLGGLQEFWDSPRSRADEDTLVGYDVDGRVVATAWAGCNRAVTERRGVYLGGAVRPDRRGEGIGRSVLRWEVAHALAWDQATREEGYGPLTLRLYAPSDQADVRDLAERQGLAVERYFFEMSRQISELPPVPDLDDVAVIDWDPARSRETHHVVDLAFHDHWGHVDRTDEMWDEVTASEAFRAEWSLVAIERATGAVVGAALNCAYEQDWQATGVTEGYTDELAVARSHRGRGIASALLVESMRRFAISDMQAAALSVDAANPSEALRLYESLGYEQISSTCAHGLASPSS